MNPEEKTRINAGEPFQPTSSEGLELEITSLENENPESLRTIAEHQFTAYKNALQGIKDLPRQEFLRRLAELSVKYFKNLAHILEAAKGKVSEDRDEEGDSEARKFRRSIIYSCIHTNRLQEALFSAYSGQVNQDQRFSEEEKQLINVGYEYLRVKAKLLADFVQNTEDDDRTTHYLKNRKSFLNTPEYQRFVELMNTPVSNLDKESLLRRLETFEKEQTTYKSSDPSTLGFYFFQAMEGASKSEHAMIDESDNGFNYVGGFSGVTRLIKDREF
ncbi:MAG: hypothetical protein HYV13_00390 [Candidatus Doudnabacteria bacterium]|nr:hypothetical protein [Candidatus Doudnabacteria bacterium]